MSLPAAAPTPAPAPAPASSSLESDEGPPPPDVVLRLRNVHKTYLLGLEGVPALRGVSLDVRAGEFIVILGRSGGGKTTLLNVLGTIDRPTRGELYVAGARVDARTPDAALARLRLLSLGFVFQAFNLLPGLTAAENVELPLVLAGAGTPAARAARARRLLARVGMAERAAHSPAQLSGGEQQRVTIARALANAPRILLLDEPTGDLDTVNSAIVLSLLLRLNARAGVTLVMVTHNPDLECYADRVVYVADGRVVGTAVNTVQTPLEHEAYLAYLHREADGDADA